MAGPLDGFRIVDLTGVISGPFATMILADQGADVIKVETPGIGDYTRQAGNQKANLSASFLNNNRNKRSITLDLKSERGKKVFHRLVKTADVLVQNFRPGVVDRIGVGEAAIREVAPDIIYVSISGFGEKGPYKGKPTYDPLIQAVSGLASVQGGSDENRPRLVRTIVPDKVTALTASQAITAALLARERGGVAQHVRLSMLDSVLAFLWSSDMGGQTFVGETISQQRAASFIDLIYHTKDGYMSVSTMTNAQWTAFANETGNSDWLEDERFSTPALRDLNINDRLELIQSVLETATTAEWMERLEVAGVPCAPVLTRKEIPDHPQIQSSEILVELEHPQAGPLRQTRPAAQFDKTPPEVRRMAPLLGQHTQEVLAELGFDDSEIENLRDVTGG
jgi:crotonobetainyl-CoA:carnitine CoA-transferase CaiB-like acyl-CoA transferase